MYSLRSLGSSALNTCYVANGSADVFYVYGIHIWDIAACALIASEAGCYVTDTNGGELNILNRRILVSATQELANQAIPFLQDVSYGESD